MPRIDAATHQRFLAEYQNQLAIAAAQQGVALYALTKDHVRCSLGRVVAKQALILGHLLTIEGRAYRQCLPKPAAGKMGEVYRAMTTTILLPSEPVFQMRNHTMLPRIAALLVLHGSWLSAQSLLHSHTEPGFYANYGLHFAGIGDVNRDGYPDYATTADNDFTYASSGGRVYVFSGKDGTVLHELIGGINERLGLDLQAVGDYDKDGFPDVMICYFEPGLRGRSYRIYSGKDWSVIRRFPTTTTLPQHDLMRMVSDVTADGVPDLLCSDPGFSTTFPSQPFVGKVWLLNGATLATIFTTEGTASNEGFGTTFCELGDIDHDQTPDFLIGAPGRYSNGNNAGAIELRSGKDWHVIYQVFGNASYQILGAAMSHLGDVDKDGYPDFAAAQAGFSTPTMPQCGRVRVHSGRTGSPIPNLVWLGEAANQLFGSQVGGVGDIDNDGVPDFGASIQPGLGQPGLIRIFSCKTGTEVMRLSGVTNQYQLGQVPVVACGDLDRDGSDDILTTGMGITVWPTPNPGKTLVYSGIRNPSIGNPQLRASPFLSFQGTGANDQFGWSVHGGLDLDGDGCSDFLVGANAVDCGTLINAGEVRAISGRQGTVLFAFQGTQVGNYLGDAARIVLDTNHDGRPDILLGGHGYSSGTLTGVGQATLYSGASGTKLRDFTGTAALQGLGQAVASAGDVDKDGDGDILLGAPTESRNGSRSGSVYLHGGSTRGYALIYRFDGNSPGDEFGTALDGIGDVNADGYDDVAIGSPFDDTPGVVDCGSVKIFSGKDGTLLRTIFGLSAGEHLGHSLAGVGDLDGDGAGDLLVGSPDAAPKGASSGRAYVFSGRTGAILFMFDGQAFGERLGEAVACAGDVDKDGKPDLLLGCPGVAGTGGRSLVYSGKTGRLLWWLDGSASDDFGLAVAGAGDLNGDGYADLIIGAPQQSSQTGAGYVRILSGYDAVSVTYGTGCPGTGGLVPDIQGSGLPRLGSSAHRIDLQRARPSASAALGIGIEPACVPLGGTCALLIASAVSLPFTTNGIGGAALPLPVPNQPELVGGNLFCQGIILDPAGAGLGTLAFSQGLHLLIGR